MTITASSTPLMINNNNAANTNSTIPTKSNSKQGKYHNHNPSPQQGDSGFQALRQARTPVAGLEPATGGSLQISGRTR
ncbi:hypothetical protein PoB_005336600 [Plakobranchus ocellatus]|uniref:Uncharacterized protein n=1 Tax=Plakobranchus ocellatus TaxID=259542 RepID=A0AAV4BUJ4_9GAST|nr:hypothetical protein PoB_005336600 [Plakobranchus ocellatus]